VLGLAALVATVAWGAVTRPMGDSPDYRLSGRILSSGWAELTDRTPAYPALLWLTGSLHRETTLLFLVQLAFHVTAVVLCVRIAGRLGLPARWRVAVTVLLVLPPPMVKVVYTGSEALAELLVVVVLWCFVRWDDRRRPGWLVGLGLATAALALTRPTFMVLVVPLALLVWWTARSRPVGGGAADRPGPSGTARRTGPVASGALVVLPALVLVGGLVLANGVRFGSWGSTPLLGWYLGSRTSLFVQELPPDRDGVRDLLVRERDRRLLLGPGTDAENYQFGIRDELARRTGRTGTDLDAYVASLNLGLIRDHPFDYLDAVSRSAERYVQIDAEPAAAGPGRAGAWAQDVVHLLLLVAFAVPLVTVPGLALRGEVAPRLLAGLACCAVVALTCAVVSCAVQTGSSRLRSPTDPLLVLMMVAGWWVLTRRRAAAPAAGPVTEPGAEAP
jgi:hypothetical protein